MTVGLAAREDLAAELLERARQGEDAAFTEIVAAHHPAMVRVAYVVTGEVDLANDAAQQAWQIAWRKLGSVRDPSALRAWLVAIAANEARHLARRESRRAIRASGPAPEAVGDPETGIASVDLLAALATLSPDDRALVAMRYLVGLDSFEIARVAGLSPSGTRARLARILARLRTELSDD